MWKKAKEGEPYWESPWGKGRPGWHIECSAMSCKHLGDNFDIHAGGNDLIFPHHENEIAQSEGANGKKFVNYWVHFGFLNINEEKMSKSLGNFFTTREVLKKYSAEALRLLYAQAHYGGPLNFTEDLLAAAQKGLEKISNLADKVEQEIKTSEGNGNPEFNFQKFQEAFEAAMDDDFNTSQAVAVIFDFIKEVNRVISENDNISKAFYLNAKDFLNKTAGDILGILDFNSLNASNSGELENELIEMFIKIRQEAKADKNFKLADKIRDELKNIGIELQDSKEKTTFKKVKS
jgi:cysteinyl-tRNA synthetase